MISENHIEQEEQIYQYGRDNEHIKVIFHSEQFLQKQFNSKILLILLLSCIQEQFYSRALELVKVYFGKIQDEEVKKQIKILQQNCFSYLNLHREQIKEFKKINYLQKNDVGKAVELEAQISKILNIQSKKTISERKEEGKDILALMEKSEKEDYMKNDGCPVFLIPMPWFNQWKKHCFFYELTEDQEEGMIVDEELDQQENDFYPGKIDVSNLFDIQINQLYDPDPVKEYTNTSLKPGLEANKDYFIMSKSSIKYLLEKYNGQELKRIIISINDENQLTQVEYFLKQINIICFPQVTSIVSQEVLSVFISRKETVNDLKEKITRCLRNLKEYNQQIVHRQARIKLWKLEEPENMQEIVEQYKLRKENQAIVIKAKLLESSTNLEDSEIAENDIIIMEFYNQEWVFKIIENVQKRNMETCAKCEKTESLMYCQCQSLKYCSRECQRQHRNKHRSECERIVTEKSQFNSIMKRCGVTEQRKFNSNSRKGLTGLQNLGNTCFMNSSIQCLSNVASLSNYMITNEFVKDLNIKNPLGSGGVLASTYAELMKEMWVGNYNYISAWDLKKIIGQVAPQFNGQSQQDSQELLSYILDGIHEDLNRIKNKPIVDPVESDGSDIDVIAQKSWQNYLRRNNSIISELMVGQFKSTIICPTCRRISITFDPFMSVSIPLTLNTQSLQLQMYFVCRDVNTLVYKINLNLQMQSTTKDVIEKLSKLLKIHQDNIQINILKDHKIIETAAPSISAKYLRDHEGLIFGYELMSEVYDKNVLNEKQIIRTKISVDRENQMKNRKGFTFQRMIQFAPTTSFKEIHLKIYQQFRPFLINCIQRMKQENEPTMFEFDLKGDKTIEDLIPEYENFLQKKFKIIIISYFELDKRVMLPYDEDDSFSRRYEINDEVTQVEFSVSFPEHINTDYMRLNRCTEFVDKEIQERSNSKALKIYDCLDLFITEETLEEGNEWYCSKCKMHKKATKRMELYRLPKILILHLKRFKTNKVFNIGQTFFSGGSSKIGTYVEFPGPDEELDMTNYCAGNTENKKIAYELIGVSNHFGGLGGGHYTAYAKNHFSQKWYDYNDQHVSFAGQKDIVTDAAYVLFYQLKE